MIGNWFLHLLNPSRLEGDLLPLHRLRPQDSGMGRNGSAEQSLSQTATRLKWRDVWPAEGQTGRQRWAACAHGHIYQPHQSGLFPPVVHSWSHVPLFASHEWQHIRLSCPSLSPRVCSNSYLLIQWCHPTISSSVIPFSSCLQSFPVPQSFPMSLLFPSGDQWCWSWCFGISPPSEYSGLISFRIDWLDLLAVEGTLKSLLQQHSSKASILQCPLFMVQLSHPYMTTGKIIVLTIWTFVSKVMSLLLNNSV